MLLTPWLRWAKGEPWTRHQLSMTTKDHAFPAAEENPMLSAYKMPVEGAMHLPNQSPVMECLILLLV